MGDFQATATVHAPKGALFDYLSEVSNLPDYFARMTTATQGDGEEVHTAARLPGGQEVEGDAWFRVDSDARRIEWGSEGDNDYHGSLEVREAGGDADVRVRMHTTRVPDNDSAVQQGLEDTVANIKRIVEERNVTV